MQRLAFAIFLLSGCSGSVIEETDPGSVDSETVHIRGKGIWIWHFGDKAPPVTVVAERAQKLGVGFVLIKSGEDDWIDTNNLNPTIVKEFTSRGIDVYAWAYVRPGAIASKVSALAKQAKIAGVKGMILDVEWEWFNQQAEATALCTGIRKAAPGVFLGYTPNLNWVSNDHRDPEPSFFPTYPWKQFDEACGDAVLPQIYWDEFADRDPLGSLHWYISGSAARGLTAPIWPIQDSDDGAASTDLNAFFDAAGPNSSLWVWPRPDQTGLSNQLSELHWSNPDPLADCRTKIQQINGLIPCKGTCADVDNDPHNCGACGHACASGGCTDGQCDDTIVCGTGLTACGASCIDLQSDPENCGRCNAACPRNWDCTPGGCSPP